MSRSTNSPAGGGEPQGDGRGPPGWRRHPATAAAVAAIVLASIIALDFRGTSAHGMNFDEVLRLNPLVRLVNPDARSISQAIYSVPIGSFQVPLMVKNYISSLTSIHLLPALLWGDQVFGLRVLYAVNLWLAAWLIFLSLFRYGSLFALGSAALLATTPHLYPEVRFGFASVVHVVCLTAAAFAWRHAFETGRTTSWFLGGAAVGLAINLRGPTLWTVGGLFVGALLLFPAELLARMRKPRSLAAALAGMLAGAVN
jgi:hypothetical protein